MLNASMQIECPTGSNEYMNLVEVAEEIQHRIIHIFGRDMEGRRATNGGNPILDQDPHFRDYVWFYEVTRSLIRFSDGAEFKYSTSTQMTAAVWVPLIKLDGT